MTQEFQNFIKTGQLPSSMAARSKILDVARNQILSKQTTSPQAMTLFKSSKVEALEKQVNQLEARLGVEPTKFLQAGVQPPAAENLTSAEIVKLNAEAAARRAARTGNQAPPPIHRAATKPATSGVTHRAAATTKPAAAAAPTIPGLTTAAAFTTTRPVMARSEFNKLSNADRSRFCVEAKGQVIDDPKPAKPDKDAQGSLTREGWNKLSPSAKSEYFAQGGKLVD